MCTNQIYLKVAETEEAEENLFGFSIENPDECDPRCSFLKNCKLTCNQIYEIISDKPDKQSILEFIQGLPVIKQVILVSKLLRQESLKDECISCELCALPMQICSLVYNESADIVRKGIKKFENFGAPVFVVVKNILTKVKISPQKIEGRCVFESFCEKIAMKRLSKALTSEDKDIWASLSKECAYCILSYQSLIVYDNYNGKDPEIPLNAMVTYAHPTDT